MIDVYSKWRQDYLEENPDKQLFNWVGRGFGIFDKPMGAAISASRPEDPIITLGEKGKKIGVLVVLVALVLLTSNRE